ncbi:nucleotide pyrophosphohydrolase [Archaeoglobales archaeon]|nr:MAG: nucleotide pyrophosphohydrolase [Archaeoglobales archaeon]
MKELIKRVAKFRDERDWREFHTPKNLAISLVIEASELLEIFQWTFDEELDDIVKLKRDKIEEEIADVLVYLLLLADVLKIDLEQAFFKKMEKNEQRYPVEKARGKANKYTEL